MRLATFFLADYAEVVNAKLYVHGGLVTQVWRESYPAPLDLSIVLVFEHTRQEAGTTHQLEVRLVDNDGDPVIQPLEGQIGIGAIPEGVPTGLPFLVPAAIRVGMPIQQAGTYAFAFLLDNNDVGSMPFVAHAAPPPGS